MISSTGRFLNGAGASKGKGYGTPSLLDPALVDTTPGNLEHFPRELNREVPESAEF